MGVLQTSDFNRERLFSPFWASRWKQSIMPVAIVAILILLLFLGNMSYIFGVVFNSESRSHNLQILAVDYDGAEIGESLLTAYQSLKGDSFPTLHYQSPSKYPTLKSLREAVCKEGYWAAIYTHSGASEKLEAAISGHTAYNSSDTITYVYDGAFYPTIAASYIEANMETLISVAAHTLYNVAINLLETANLTDPTSASAFLDPIRSSSTVIMPTTQGTRVLLNTITMIMPVLMQFFFVMASNGIFTSGNVYLKLTRRDLYLLRLLINKLYTLFSGLVTAGYIWAYRESWSVTTGQFFETWMCLWFYADISYLIMDTVVGALIPMQFCSFFMLTWIITNVSSTIFPFELSAGCFRWGYALPAHNVWRLLVDIWSDGCKSQREVALPVLFVWWVLGHIGSMWSSQKRCQDAERLEEKTF